MRTIDIQAKEWLDRLNGNSYFSAQITIDGIKTYNIPFQYGYESAYMDASFRFLFKNGLIKEEVGRYYSWCKENSIILNASIKRGCRKSDVVKFGEE